MLRLLNVSAVVGENQQLPTISKQRECVFRKQCECTHGNGLHYGPFWLGWLGVWVGGGETQGLGGDRGGGQARPDPDWFPPVCPGLGG